MFLLLLYDSGRRRKRGQGKGRGETGYTCIRGVLDGLMTNTNEAGACWICHVDVVARYDNKRVKQGVVNVLVLPLQPIDDDKTRLGTVLDTRTWSFSWGGFPFADFPRYTSRASDLLTA